jgi:hypothetical protein
MDDYDNVELGTRILPGVDLALWFRIVVAALVTALVAVGLIAAA